MLLKATHLPFVAAICVYEQFAGREGKPGAAPTSRPEPHTAGKRLGRSTIQSPRTLSAGYPATSEGNGSAPGRSQFANRPSTRGGPQESDSQLKSLVVKLTTQVEQLAAIVAELQEQREANMAV